MYTRHNSACTDQVHAVYHKNTSSLMSLVQKEQVHHTSTVHSRIMISLKRIWDFIRKSPNPWTLTLESLGVCRFFLNSNTIWPSLIFTVFKVFHWNSPTFHTVSKILITIYQSYLLAFSFAILFCHSTHVLQQCVSHETLSLRDLLTQILDTFFGLEKDPKRRALKDLLLLTNQNYHRNTCKMTFSYIYFHRYI